MAYYTVTVFMTYYIMHFFMKSFNEILHYDFFIDFVTFFDILYYDSSLLHIILWHFYDFLMIFLTYYIMTCFYGIVYDKQFY